MANKARLEGSGTLFEVVPAVAALKLPGRLAPVMAPRLVKPAVAVLIE